MAEDVDQGQNGQVTYSIESSSQSGLFKIDPLTGSITTAAIMDREIWTQAQWVYIMCAALVRPMKSLLCRSLISFCSVECNCPLQHYLVCVCDVFKPS